MMSREKEDWQEDLILASDQSGKIGKAVTVDVDGSGGREVFTGVFTSGVDKYKENGDIQNTTLIIGGREILLDWDNDETLTALINIG